MQQNSKTDQNFLKRISDRLLFIRSASESEVTKITHGRRSDLACKKWTMAHTTAVGGMIESDELTKKYSLPTGFRFDLECAEFIVVHQFYEGFKRYLENKSPAITFDELLRSEYTPQPARKTRKAGRPKASKDNSTGKLKGLSSYSIEVIEHWEANKDVEAIRLAMYPKTRTPTQKSVEREKILRNLRRLKHLLIRPYNTK